MNYFKNKLFIALSFICIIGQAQAMFVNKSQKQNPVVASALSAIPASWHYKKAPLKITHEPDQDSIDMNAVVAEHRLRHQIEVNSAETFIVNGKSMTPQAFIITDRYTFNNSDKEITITSYSRPVREIKKLNIINKTRGKSVLVPAKRNDILAMIITKNHISQNSSESKGYKTVSDIHKNGETLHIQAYLENGETDCIIEHPEGMQFPTNI